ncbi:NfeD family protein [bacterium]|nr:NfeD family protein [candidate division CSSED10-310 bacterium]
MMGAWWASLSTIQHVLFYIAVPSTTFMLAQLAMTLLGLGGHEHDFSHALEHGGDMPDVHLELETAHEMGHFELSDGADHEMTIATDHDMGGGSHELAEETAAGHGGLVHVDQSAPSHAESYQQAVAGFKMLSVRSVIALLVGFSWSSLSFMELGLAELPAVAAGGVVGFGLMSLVAYILHSVSRLSESGTVHLQSAVGQTAAVYIPIPAKADGTGRIQLIMQGRLREIDALTYDDARIPTGAKVIVVAIDRDRSTAVVTLE